AATTRVRSAAGGGPAAAQDGMLSRGGGGWQRGAWLAGPIRRLPLQPLDRPLQPPPVAVVGVHLQEDFQGQLGLLGVPLGDESLDLLDPLLHRLLAPVGGLQAIDLGEHGGDPGMGGNRAFELARYLACAIPVLVIEDDAVAALELGHLRLLLALRTDL